VKHLLSTFAISSLLIVSIGSWLPGNLTPRVRAQDARVSIEPRAKPASSGNASRADSNFTVTGSLVLVPVLVTDPQDHLVTGLDKQHFKIFEDKVEQPITHFASEDAPMTVALVFDSSGSMGAKLQKSRAAVAEFLRIANPEDEFALIQFNDTAKLSVPFTRKGQEIQSQLMFTQSKGRTALLDALYLALLEMKHAHNSRKALLIISDGGDNSSRYTTREVKALVQESDVQIYSIGIFESLARRSQTPEELNGPDLLGDVATQSGGRLFEIHDLNELPDVASKIAVALRNEYVLGYSPVAAKRDGKYHRIQVKMARVKGVPPLRAFFRSGYYASTE